MNVEIDFGKLKVGDRLVRNKGAVLSKHHVLYTGFWNGKHIVAENQTGYGVRYISLEQFLSQGELDRVEHNDFNDASQTEILSRINQRIGTAYSLVDYNCEHFVNEILTGVAKSKQINNGLAIAIGVALCLLAFGGNSDD